MEREWEEDGARTREHMRKREWEENDDRRLCYFIRVLKQMLQRHGKQVGERERERERERGRGGKLMKDNTMSLCNMYVEHRRYVFKIFRNPFKKQT